MVNNFYAEIDFVDAESVQRDCYESMSNLIDLTQTEFMWPKNHSLLQINSLQRELKLLELDEFVFGATINVSVNFRSDIHIDHAESGWRYSLNIPISGFDNTFITFYETYGANSEIKPRHDSKGNDTGKTYTNFDEKESVQIARFETNKPFIIDTQTPHCFESFTGIPRVILLLRLKGEFDDKLFQEFFDVFT